MHQIFNELSIDGNFSSKQAANSAFEALISHSKKLHSLGFNDAIRITNNYSNICLLADYTVNHWIRDKDSGFDHNQQLLFLNKVTSEPYIETEIEAYQDAFTCLLDFQFTDRNAMALGATYLLNGVSLAFSRDLSFCKDTVSFTQLKINKNDEVSTESFEVLSIWTEDQIERLHQKIIELLPPISNGPELIEYIASKLTTLRLAPKAKKLILSLSGSEQYFAGIILHLQEIHDSMTNYQSGSFNPKLNWSPESHVTMDKYGKSREFKCSDNTTRVFSNHSKILHSNFRIYFLADQEHGMVHIGYIGKHLPTISDPT